MISVVWTLWKKYTETVSPEQDLPSDSVENHATAEAIRPSDEMQLTNAGSALNDETEQSER